VLQSSTQALKHVPEHVASLLAQTMMQASITPEQSSAHISR
jgi:hypothetical protein